MGEINREVRWGVEVGRGGGEGGIEMKSGKMRGGGVEKWRGE